MLRALGFDIVAVVSFGADLVARRYRDLLSRTMLAPTEIPVGVVTTFVGAPLFVYLLRRGRKTA